VLRSEILETLAPFVPSDEQMDIFDVAVNTADNIGIDAKAGTGKTTTIVQLAKLLPKKAKKRFCAFNKPIAEELDERLRGTGTDARTFHSMGVGALIRYFGGKKMKLDDRKYKKLILAWLALPDENEWRKEVERPRELALEIRRLVAEYVNKLPPDERKEIASEMNKQVVDLMDKLVGFLRLKLLGWTETTALRDLIDYYSFQDTLPDEFVGIAVEIVPYIMGIAEKMVKDAFEVDFTDQIYWAVYWNLPLTQYDYLLADEAQDINPMQRTLLMRSIKSKTGRIIFVGDPNQSIMGFAGADSDSFDLTVKAFNAKVLPLTYTRRCDQVITYHAAGLVPEFRCPPEKPRGKFVWLDESRMAGVMQPGDMGVCRMKAPLVTACLNVIAEGKPATILGSDIEKSLIAMLEKLEKRGDYKDFDDLEESLNKYEVEQVDYFMTRDEEQAADAIADQCAALRTIIERAKAPSIFVLKQYIETLFSSGKKEDMVVFVTAHKSKGLEANRVFILAPDRMPLSYPNMLPESAVQEMNLLYVALTRAKHVVVILTNEKYRKNNTLPSYGQTDFEDHDWSGEILERSEEIGDEQSPQAVEYVYNAQHDDFDLVPVQSNDSPVGETLPADDEANETPTTVVITPVPEKVDKLRAVASTLTDDELDTMIRYLTQFREERKKVGA